MREVSLMHQISYHLPVILTLLLPVCQAHALQPLFESMRKRGAVAIDTTMTNTCSQR